MVVLNQSEEFELGDDTTVRRMGFGAMRLTGEDVIGPPDSEAEARGVLERAVEIGVDFVDTADSYGPGVSERLVGETLGDRDDVVVATKAGLLRNPDGDWIKHGDPDYLWDAMLSSLDRLRTDQIDLYQYHRPDPDVDFEEAVSTFAEMKDEGYVRHVGLSNVDVDQLEQARDVVEIATVQNRYNVADREHEDVLEACEDHGIGFVPWYPMGGGDLGGKADVLDEVAEANDATRRQVALAWLLEHSDVTIPIPGTGSVDHLEENVAAAGIQLSDDEYARLTE
jgi:aryl-alcohol dehydrogenase-like predicted oxidoreductase